MLLTRDLPPPSASESPQRDDSHWRCNQRLTAALLLAWFVASFIATFFARELNSWRFGWPLGFWVAAQGAPLLYVLLVGIYARQMRRIDQRRAATEAH